MQVRLASPAQTELADALEWYASIHPSLAVRFLDEYELLLKRLRENPWQFPTVRNSVRRAVFRHFPYGLFYRVRSVEVEIIACFHARRSPRRWQDRN
jgi:plasmid stabilization system protein ParE